MELRNWQKRTFKVIDRVVKSDSDKAELVSITACVGSGKTLIGSYAFGKFIDENRDSETVQMFVTPRIKLCKQQTSELEKNLEELFNFKNERDYLIIPVDCTQNKEYFNTKNPILNNSFKHTIFVVCDASLWGIEKQANNPMIRFSRWINAFTKWKEEGKKFGFIFEDEAHNYENNQEQMFGDKKF